MLMKHSLEIKRMVPFLQFKAINVATKCRVIANQVKYNTQPEIVQHRNHKSQILMT